MFVTVFNTVVSTVQPKRLLGHEEKLQMRL